MIDLTMWQLVGVILLVNVVSAIAIGLISILLCFLLYKGDPYSEKHLRPK